MALYVRNATNKTLNVALGYRWDNCPDGDNWGKKGVVCDCTQWERNCAGRSVERSEVLCARACL